MAEARVERRLAAILAADAVGYSRLMEADEAGTLAALKRHRETVFGSAKRPLPKLELERPSACCTARRYGCAAKMSSGSRW